MSDDVRSYEDFYFFFSIVCTNVLFKKKNPLARCVAQNQSRYKNLDIFFVLSTKYQLDECALNQEYNKAPDQIPSRA